MGADAIMANGAVLSTVGTVLAHRPQVPRASAHACDSLWPPGGRGNDSDFTEHSCDLLLRDLQG